MKANLANRPSIERVRAVLAYEPETGVLRWLVARGKRPIGAPAGYVVNGTYAKISLFGKELYAHVVAWALFTGEWPDGPIDHRNLNYSDNRAENLREATYSLNRVNTRKPSTNTSGLKGATWCKRTRKWLSSTKIKGRTKFLGYHETKELAHAAYVDFMTATYGDFARAA
jgi:hypothetical protein